MFWASDTIEKVLTRWTVIGTPAEPISILVGLAALCSPCLHYGIAELVFSMTGSILKGDKNDKSKEHPNLWCTLYPEMVAEVANFQSCNWEGNLRPLPCSRLSLRSRKRRPPPACASRPRKPRGTKNPSSLFVCPEECRRPSEWSGGATPKGWLNCMQQRPEKWKQRRRKFGKFGKVLKMDDPP